jgi:hypothetical protein
MPLLFSYGTLQHEDVQLSTFGRKLDGRRDAIVGFEPSLVRIEDPAVVAGLGRTHHANATFNGNPESRVAGTVFEVTEAEGRLGPGRQGWCAARPPRSLATLGMTHAPPLYAGARASSER